ncbi:MAG: hypothetical protein QOF88_7329, partial [Mycobacterium sp.]|nr:hypothetical protein [Mycobacterium sp.]
MRRDRAVAARQQCRASVVLAAVVFAVLGCSESTPEAGLVAAARRQQAAYRAIGRHPDWDAVTRPRIPLALLEV